LFSIDIIGNPIGLFTNLVDDIKKMKDNTGKGFVKGPLEGGL
jgi:hypothetical protein